MIESTNDLRGLNSVRVKKDDVLNALKKNRDDHRGIYEEAIDNWQKEVVARLEQMVEKAKRGINEIVLNVGLQRPDDHTKDYNRAIRMLEMSQDDELELSEHEFAQYVMDDWGWQQNFLRTASAYSMMAADKEESLYNQ